MLIVEIDRETPDEGALDEAAGLIERGGVVVIPTDTVYGLAAGAMYPDALGRIYRMKRRPEGMPLAVILACVDDLWPMVRDLSSQAERIVRERLPGPVTFVMARSEIAPRLVAPGVSTIAVRVPECRIATGVARRAGGCFAATSANPSGEPAPATFGEIASAILDEVDLALDAGPCPVGRASAVVDLTGREPVVIRQGPGWE